MAVNMIDIKDQEYNKEQTLVPNEVRMKRVTQHIAAIIATVGGLIVGTTLAWTSPTEIPLRNGTYGFPVSENDISWIGGTLSLGAIAGCILTGLFVDTMGRKSWIMFLSLPCTAGWSLMIWSHSTYMFYYGRFFTGISTAGYCLAIPIYTAEISEKEIRGTLGTYLQLQITIGVLAVYIIGSYVDVFTLTLMCGIIPVVFFLLMALLPETPYFYLKKSDKDSARKSMKWLRDSRYDVDFELKIIQEAVDKDKEDKISYKEAFQTRAAKRGLVIGLGIFFFQQFCGSSFIIFYAGSIFRASGGDLDSGLCSIIIGFVCMVATWVATLLVDRLGRRVLLLFSIFVMMLCLSLLTAYFYTKVDLRMDLNHLDRLPLISLCVYMFALSMGMAPLPWLLVGEIFPSQIRGCACSVACLFNWICVFVVTKGLTSLAPEIGMAKVFALFTVCCLVGFAYIYVLLPETKGKSLEQIRVMLDESRSGSSSDRRRKSSHLLELT